MQILSWDISDRSLLLQLGKVASTVLYCGRKARRNLQMTRCRMLSEHASVRSCNRDVDLIQTAVIPKPAYLDIGPEYCKVLAAGSHAAAFGEIVSDFRLCHL
jgi:hypothetical protein